MVFFKKDTAIGNLVTGLLASFLVTVILAFGCKRLCDNYQSRVKLLRDLFRKEHEEKVELPQVELNEDFEQSIKQLLKLKKSALEDLSIDCTVGTQQNQSILEEYDREIKHLETMQKRQIEILQQSNSLVDQFNMQNWKYGEDVKYAQDSFIKHIKYERYSHNRFCSYLSEFKVDSSLISNQFEPNLSSAMIYINCVPSITYIFKSASALLSAIGSLQTDHQVSFVQYCQRVYDFDCQVVLKTEISLFNKSKSDLCTYVGINYWINKSVLRYIYYDGCINSLKKAKHSLGRFLDAEYSSMVTFYRRMGMGSTIDQFKNSISMQPPRSEIDRITLCGNSVMQEIVEELDSLNTVEVTAIDNMQSELPQASLISRKVINLIRAKEELENLIQKKQKLSSEDGPYAEIDQIVSYLRSKFSEVKDHILVHLPANMSQKVIQVQASLDLHFRGRSFSLEFEGKSLSDIKQQILCLCERLFQEEEDQIKSLKSLQYMQDIVKKFMFDLDDPTGNVLLYSLYDNLKCYVDLLESAQTAFSEQERILEKDNNIVHADLLSKGLPGLQKVYDILYTRYRFLEQNHNKIEEAQLKLLDIYKINSCWGNLEKSIQHSYILYEQLGALGSKYTYIDSLLNRLQKLSEATFLIKDGSSYLDLLDIPEGERNGFLDELSRQEDSVKLLELLSTKKIDFSILNSRMTDQLMIKQQSLNECLSVFKDKRNEILMDSNVVRFLSEGIKIDFVDRLEGLKKELIFLNDQNEQLMFSEHIKEINSVISSIEVVSELLSDDDKIPEQKVRKLINSLCCLQEDFSVNNQLLNLLNLKKEIQEERKSRLPVTNELQVVFLKSDKIESELLRLKNEIDEIIDQVNELLIIEEDTNVMNQIKEFVGVLSGLLYDASHKENISELLCYIEKKEFNDLLSKLENHMDFSDDEKHYVERIVSGLKNISKLSNELQAKQIERSELDSTSLTLARKLMSIGYQLSVKEKLSVLDDLSNFFNVLECLRTKFVKLYKETVYMIRGVIDTKKCNETSFIELINETLKSLDDNSNLSITADSFISEELENFGKLRELQGYVLELEKEDNNTEEIINELLDRLSDGLTEKEIRLCKNLKNIASLDDMNETFSQLKTCICKTKDKELSQYQDKLNKFVDDIIVTYTDTVDNPYLLHEDKGFTADECRKMTTLYSKIKSSLEDLQSILRQDNIIMIPDAEQKIQEIYESLKDIFLENCDLSNMLSDVLSRSKNCEEKLGLNTYVTHFLSFINLLNYHIIEKKFYVEGHMIANLNDQIHQQEMLVLESRAAVNEEVSRSVQRLLDQSIYYPRDLINVRLIKRKLIDNGIICDDLMKILEDDVRAKVACSSNVMVALMHREDMNRLEDQTGIYKEQQMSHARRLQLYKVIKKFMDNSIDGSNVQYLREIDDSIQQPSAILCSSENRSQHEMATVSI
ncbi:hypothetical protein [Ehrlichia japonica]|uniref:Uncharacterized protein n=1 Tax=Ehrlichia japonica TaxID=391036 RepID=X5GJV7_9RICK|nr:hypothetical protein [Ehrlichia japonica]AHX04738.1 hypothetical protein EHF_0515 [Ehrlichia japonica]